GDAVAGDLDLVGQRAVGGVVLQEVGVDLRRGEVVDRYQVDVGSRPAGGPVEVSPDPPEAVDADSYRHGPSWTRSVSVLPDQAGQGVRKPNGVVGAAVVERHRPLDTRHLEVAAGQAPRVAQHHVDGDPVAG